MPTVVSFGRVQECAGQGVAPTCIARKINNVSLSSLFPLSLKNNCTHYEDWYDENADDKDNPICFAHTLMEETEYRKDGVLCTVH